MTKAPRGGRRRRATRSRPDRAGTIASRKSTVSRRGAKKTGLLSVFCFPVSQCPASRRSPCQSVIPHRNVSSYHGVPLSSSPPWTEPPRSGSSVTTCGIPARRARSRRSPRAASGTARPFAKAEKDGRILRSPLAKGKAVRYNMGIVCIFALCALSRAHGLRVPRSRAHVGVRPGSGARIPYAPPPPPPDTHKRSADDCHAACLRRRAPCHRRATVPDRPERSPANGPDLHHTRQGGVSRLS